jgi:hypothetical protein
VAQFVGECLELARRGGALRVVGVGVDFTQPPVGDAFQFGDFGEVVVRCQGDAGIRGTPVSGGRRYQGDAGIMGVPVSRERKQ